LKLNDVENDTRRSADLPDGAAVALELAGRLLDVVGDLDAGGWPFTASRVRELALGLAGEAAGFRVLHPRPHVSRVPDPAAVAAILEHGVAGEQLVADDETLPLFPPHALPHSARRALQETSRGTFADREG
jgi:hypothetical protein